MMSHTGQLVRGALWGIAAIGVAIVGLFGALGLWTEERERAEDGEGNEAGDRNRSRLEIVDWRDTALAPLPGEPAALAPMLSLFVAALVLISGGWTYGYAGLPYVIGAALLVLCPAAWRRPGLLVFVVVSAMYLPLMGAFSLWDPWETHYGEVAREILSRDDWISLWWAQDGWFWSKPILIFWSEALSLSAFGVDATPDANPLAPEWSLRLPVMVMSLGALLAAYAAMRKVFGARAGALGALVLATCPHFFFLSHQAITDIPLVANITIAMSMLILALNVDTDERVRGYRFGRVVVSGQHAAIGAVTLLMLPQALYLLSRNIAVDPNFGIALSRDEFLFGSAGNEGVAGNAALRMDLPYVLGAGGQPVVQGLLWLSVLAVVIFMLRRERRTHALYMTGFYLFCGLAFMGKGIIGFAIPGLIALLYLVGSSRWSMLASGRLHVARGMLTVSAVGLPWYVAMFVRHGPGFTDRLLVHDHINRLGKGVHGDTGSIQYFILQLGYATFPWVALVPAAALAWLWYLPKRDSSALAPDEPIGKRQTLMLLCIWFFGTFAVFSAMITKFHHYIFPAVPPLAMLVGIVLAEMWGTTGEHYRPRAITQRVATALAVLSPAPLILGVAGLWGNLRGIVPESVDKAARADWVLTHGPPAALAFGGIALGVVMSVAGFWLLRREDGREDSRSSIDSGSTPSGISETDSRHRAASLGVAIAMGAVVVAFVGRDLSWITASRPHGFERLIHLFVYNYGRPWPDHFDYRPIVTGVAVVAATIWALATFRIAHRWASRAALGAALFFCVWTLNVYMVDLSPHWGMRELIKRYYQERESTSEPLVAWQMNWKGENFYTGNRVQVFVELDNKKVKEWIQENEGRTAFFVLEHTRLGGFKGLVHGKKLREVTTLRENNKFILLEVAL